MKKLFTGLTLLLGAATAHAQTFTDPRSQFTQLVDSLISPLDKSRIPGSILYDRVPATANLHLFTQYTGSNASHFFQSYFELKESAYGLASFTQERSSLRPLAESMTTADRTMGGDLPIGILDYQFAVLDTLAEERGTIREIGGLYYDGSGSPYEAKRVTVISPLADTVAGQVRLTMPALFQFQNTSRQPSHCLVQVGSSQYTLSGGGSALVTFPSSGYQGLTFTMYFTDGSSAIARSGVIVKSALATRPNGVVTMPISPNIIGGTWNDYNGQTTYGEGEALSYLFNPQSQADGKLRNPLIVMDGFDPSDKRKIDRIYGDFSPLIPALQVAGKERDLIVLNFPKTRRRVDMPRQTVYKDVDGGADYIERNSLVLVELLSRIKPLMADPNQKVSIIGPSMGGLISRYALALMEKNFANSGNPATYNNPYWKHNVDLWFSFDGPHQGANIPMGDQEFIDYFSGMSEAAENNAARLNSIAAKQMLVNHRLDQGGTNYHIPFMRALQNNGLAGSYGYPTQVRRVALANGIINGQMNTGAGTPGATGLQLDVARIAGNKRRQFFYRSTTPGTQISANMYFAPAAGQRGTVFNGEARVIVAMLKPVQKRREIKLTSGSQGSYDLAPGGTYDSQFQIQDGTLKGKQLPGYEFRFSNLRPLHSFIPTVSALGFQYKNMANYNGTGQLPNPYTDLSSRSLSCNDETPFDSYYAYPYSNGAHVTVDDGAKAFIVRELFNVTQPATFRPSNPTTICPNGTAYISLNDCNQRLSNVTYNWSLTGPGAFTTSGTGSVTNGGTVQAIKNNTGQAGTITVSVVAVRAGAAPSPAVTYSFQVTAGGDPLDAYITFNQGQVRICPYSTVTVHAEGLTSGPYTWTKRTIRAGTTTTPQTITTTSPDLPVTVRYDEIEVTVTAPGSCSGVNLPKSYVYVSPEPSTDGRYCDPYSYYLSPVPSNQYFMISTVENTDPQQAQEAMALPEEENPHAYHAELFNDRGKKVKTGNTKNGKLRFDTADLPNGIYHVQLRRGSQTQTRNLIIQH
ncbi:T9SS type A sorting domain-containing protein [Hymenobacter sp. DG01]|uniref:T9SS type A sorting domain-containing protein n=1 Tax=Hymenobacter sp. DG01 TaxID=2584940 RepID=UPI00111CAB9E|nr:T9SS type A sorting domain-containing protein [Hymenobacter sp. DG01]